MMTGTVSDLYGQLGQVPNGPLLVDLWRELVRFAEKHATAPRHQTEVYDGLTSEFLADLSKVDAEQWRRLCWGLGPNVYGCVGLSWCDGAQAADVWMDWKQSGYILEPGALAERPARFVNPRILPERHSLSDIVRLSEGDQTVFAVMVSRAGPQLAFDLRWAPSLAMSSEVRNLLIDRLTQRVHPSHVEADWLMGLTNRSEMTAP